MNQERLAKIILTDLELEHLKLSEELEYWVNCDSEINKRTKKIKNLLSKIVNNESMVEKFKTFLPEESK